MSREQLLRDVWRYHQLAVIQTVDNDIAKLRTHGAATERPRYITARGSGYQLII